MPSRAWVVTWALEAVYSIAASFNALSGLSCYLCPSSKFTLFTISFNALSGLSCYATRRTEGVKDKSFNALSGLSCYFLRKARKQSISVFQCPLGLELLRGEKVSAKEVITCFNALSGLSCYDCCPACGSIDIKVSMPSRAWVVTWECWQ